MKIAMAQMSMHNSMNDNYKKTTAFISQAATADLLMFPSLQLSPYFPQIKGLDARNALNREGDARLVGMAYQAKKYNTYITPNVYLEKDGKRLEASLWFDRYGEVKAPCAMAHVYDTEEESRKEYFDEPEESFRVYPTAFGKVGIVVETDRHFPESIRSCTAQGAQIVLMPVSVSNKEDMELMKAELRVQAYENGVYICVCNRCGKEPRMTFVGHSMMIDPNGEIVVEGNNAEGLLFADADLELVKKVQEERPFLKSRRPNLYKLL